MIAQTPSNSPWELLRETAGLEVHEQGQGPGFPSDMSIRGFSSDHSTDMALWVDGVPINEPVNGHAEGLNDFSSIFPEVVSGIDVIKGPTSAVYGNFAFSGVVNVRTLDRIDNTQLDVSGGNYGNYEGVLLSGFDNGVTAGMIGIRATHEDGWRAHSENQLGQLHGRLEHNLSSNTTVDLGMEAYITTYNSPGFLDTLDYDVRHYNDRLEFRRRRIQAPVPRARKHPHPLQPESRVAHDALRHRGHAGTSGSAPRRDWADCSKAAVSRRASTDGRTGGGGTSALTYTSAHVNITAGGQARYDNSDYENWGEFATATAFRRDSVPFGLTSAHQASGGLFVQSNFDVTHWLRFDLGGRVDQIDSYSHTPSSYNDTLSAPSYYALGPYADLQHSKGIFSPKTGLSPAPPPVGGRLRQYLTGVAAGGRRDLRSHHALDHGLGLRDGDQTGRGPVVARGCPLPHGSEQHPGVQRGVDDQRRTEQTARRGRIRALRRDTGSTAVDELHRRRRQVHEVLRHGRGHRLFRAGRCSTRRSSSAMPHLEVHPPHAIWQWRLGSNFQGKYTPFEEAVGLYRPAFALFYTSGGVQISPTRTWRSASGICSTRSIRELESGYFVTPGQPISVFATLHYDVPL